VIGDGGKIGFEFEQKKPKKTTETKTKAKVTKKVTSKAE